MTDEEIGGRIFFSSTGRSLVKEDEKLPSPHFSVLAEM
jgi:hypothetical protein